MGFWEWILGRSRPSEDELFDAAPASAPRLTPPASAVHEAATPKPAVPHYGIDQAIALMRALPIDEDPDLVLQVVRRTFRSTGVSVENLLTAARAREATFHEGIAGERSSIEEHERRIAAARKHIDEIAAQLKETEGVRLRLQEALQNETKVGILPADEMARLEAAAVEDEEIPSCDSNPPSEPTLRVAIDPAKLSTSEKDPPKPS